MAPKQKTADVVFQGLEAGLRMFRWVVVVLLVLFLFSGVTKIEPDRVGLLLRFGKLQGETPGERVRQPGLLLALPFPIDEVRQVPGKEREGEVVIEEVWKELSETATTDLIDPVLEGYCLTGDHNILQTKVVVKYQVTDPIAFELWTSQEDREAILHDVVLASLVQTLAGWKIDDALNLQRSDPTDPNAPAEPLAELVWQRAQQRLDAMDARGESRGCGMTISALEFEENHPPRHVKADFDRVQSAKITMETLKKQAEGDFNRQKANAEAEANQIIQAATAYYDTVTAQANAEVSEFKQLHEEYQKNPAMVWRRIYVETIETVFQNVKKHFVSRGTRIILEENGKDQS